MESIDRPNFAALDIAERIAILRRVHPDMDAMLSGHCADAVPVLIEELERQSPVYFAPPDRLSYAPLVDWPDAVMLAGAANCREGRTSFSVAAHLADFGALRANFRYRMKRARQDKSPLFVARFALINTLKDPDDADLWRSHFAEAAAAAVPEAADAMLAEMTAAGTLPVVTLLFTDKSCSLTTLPLFQRVAPLDA